MIGSDTEDGAVVDTFLYFIPLLRLGRANSVLSSNRHDSASAGCSILTEGIIRFSLAACKSRPDEFPLACPTFFSRLISISLGKVLSLNMPPRQVCSQHERSASIKPASSACPLKRIMSERTNINAATVMAGELADLNIRLTSPQAHPKQAGTAIRHAFSAHPRKWQSQAWAMKYLPLWLCCSGRPDGR